MTKPKIKIKKMRGQKLRSSNLQVIIPASCLSDKLTVVDKSGEGLQFNGKSMAIPTRSIALNQGKKVNIEIHKRYKCHTLIC